MTRLVFAAALAAAATACADLPEIGANECGNGVVEANEDCDGAAASGTCGTTGDNACHFVCDNNATCPDGYTCGADMRCRAPSAVFYAGPGPYPFDADDLAAGDVDGDGTADLVGVSATSLTARFGNDSADLFNAATQPIRTPVAHSVFSDLDGDGHMDVLVPNSIGIFTFLAAGQGFNPFPYTSISLDDQVSPVRTGKVDVIPVPFSSVLAMIGKNMSYIDTKPQYAACIDGGTPPGCLLSQHDAGDLLGDTLFTGKSGYEFGLAVGAADFTDELVLAFKGAAYVDIWSPKLPQFLPSGDPDMSTLTLEKIETLALPKEGAFAAQVKVADDGVAAFGMFDKDACPDLLISIQRTDASGRYEGFAIAYGTKGGLGGCTGKLDAPLVVAEAAIDAGQTTKGLVPRAVADFDGDGVTDVVTNALIAKTSCTRDQTSCKNNLDNVFALDFLSFTPRGWTAAVATDVNHDGAWDLAGVVAGQDDLDVMIGVGNGLFNRFQIATSLPPRFLRTGDFDGDLFMDVAAVIGDHSDPSTEDDHLVVSYGAAAGGPSATVDMGSFGVVQQAEPVQLFTDLESIDAISDVILIADRGTHRGVAPLVGSSTRRLLAPYLLGEGQATAQQRDTPVAIQVGQFDGDQAAYPDVAALGHLVPTDTPVGTTGNDIVDPTPRMFLLQGQGDGDLIGGQPMLAPVKSSDFEYRDALWVSGRLDPSSKNDAIIGIDATDDRRAEASALAPHLFIARAPTGAATDWALVPPAALPSPYNSMRVHALHLADLDADGAPDLIVEMTGASIGAGPANKVATSAFVAWTKSGTPDMAQASSVYPANTFCRGSAPIQADLDKGRELAAICTDTSGAQAVDVFRWSGSAWTIATTLGVAGQEPEIVVGDFNGDKLDDVAITSGTGPTATVQVYVQCAAGDTACAAKAQLSTPSGM